jgi:hypothetical protein
MKKRIADIMEKLGVLRGVLWACFAGSQSDIS